MNDQKIRTAFQRLDRDVRATVRPAEGLDRVRRRRWGRLLLVPVGAAAVVALIVGAGALLLRGTEPLPPATSQPTDITAPPTPTTLPETATTLPGGPPVRPTVVTAGELLLARPTGVSVVRNGEPVRIVGASARVAVGDRSGGILYESGGDIYRLRANAETPEILGPDAELHDTAIVDGQAVVVFARYEAVDGSDGVAGQVWYAPLDSPAEPVLLYESPGFEGSITRVSHGGGVFAITLAAEGIEWFEFVDATGDPVNVANPRPFEADATDDRYTDQGVLSRDGGELLFLQSAEPVIDVGDSIDVVRWNLATGAELQRFDVDAGTEGSFWFARADYDGARLLLGRLDAERRPLGPLEITLSPPAVFEVPVAGTPSIAGPAAPSSSVAPDPQAALVPAEGFGRGMLVATGERVVWYPDPSDPLAEGSPSVVWEFADDEQMLGAERYAFDDGAGGVVFGGGDVPLRWLPPGASAADVVVLGPRPGEFPLGVRGVAEIDGARAVYATRFDGEQLRLLTIELETGTVSDVGAIDTDGGWFGSLSFDGERFWAGIVARPDGEFCSRTYSIGLDGSVGGVSGVPAACTATSFFEQARVSSDGSLVAYVESGYAGTEPELGVPIRTVPIDLVVADTSTGAEVARVAVGTDVQDVVIVHDFDGERLVVARQSEEPALSQQALFVIDLGCGGCAGRLDAVAASAGLTGPAEPPAEIAELEPLPGCSLDGSGAHADEQPGLPEPVAAMRASILDAAERCDFTTLDELALDGEFSYDFDDGFAGMFRQAEAAGSPELRLIAQLLGFPNGTVDAGGETIYVWPAIATYDSWDQVTVDEQNQLSFVYDFPAQRQFADFGAYIGLRVGITESGDWIFVATGD